MVMSKRTKFETKAVLKVQKIRRVRGLSSKISKFASGFIIPDDAKSRCPKCSSDIIEHPSLVSMPLSSSPDDRSNTRKINIEDQDANFVFKFSSCKNCGYIASSIYIIKEAEPEFNF